MMPNMKLLTAALFELGTREKYGKAANDGKIVDWLKNVLPWASEDEIPWCSAFMNAMAAGQGLEHTGKANARSWLEVGQEVGTPTPGDVVIFWRESPKSWKGHVGIYLNADDYGNIYVLGGNQGNMVSVKAYPATRLLGYRRLRYLHEITETDDTPDQ